MTRIAGFSGTVFRLQGGSLVEGEDPPFDKVVYVYSILDGIRDGYLVPAFSAPAVDKVDAARLKKRQGEFTGESQDAQMLPLLDSHICQMIQHGADRRAWLIFEASTKSAKAMTARLQQWGVSAGLVLGETPNGERRQLIADFIAGRLRALVNVAALTTGFDAQIVDMLVMRRRTMSLGLYIQMTGRLLRTIGGNIDASIAAGKADGLVLDFADNISTHGPLDFLRPKDTKLRLVSCEACNARVPSAASKCWSCDAIMTKLCPACLATIEKGLLDCPQCNHDMRLGEAGPAKPQKLLETPSGAALIASFAPRTGREGGWVAVKRAWSTGEVDDANGQRWNLPAELAAHATEARWLRGTAGVVEALLKPNGLNRNSVLQVLADGAILPIPMPAIQEKAA